MTVVTADEFTTAWEEFFRATRRARARSTMEGLSLAQYQLLERLLGEEALTVSELAASAGVTSPTATRMLDVLAREGIAERRVAGHDRRVVLVSLTETGREAVEAGAARIAAARARVRDRLTLIEQEQAAKLLRRLASIVEEEL